MNDDSRTETDIKAQTDGEKAAQRAAELRLSRRRRWARSPAVRVLFCALVLFAGVWALLSPGPVHAAAIEAGEPVEPALFVADPEADAALGPGAEDVDTTVPGVYKVPVLYRGRTYTARLTVEDTVPPDAVGKTLVVAQGEKLTAESCVEDIRDVTEVTADWVQAPDMEKIDELQSVTVRLTDAGGNRTDVQALVTVKYDAVAPVIQGTKDITAFLGDGIAYREGVTVRDETDPAPTLSIDNSDVDINAPGTYTVTYTATDAAGNRASETVNVTLKEKPADYVEEETVYEAARETYDSIIEDGMTDMEKAFAIYRWVKNFIDYWDHSPHDYWTIGAYQAFTQKAGDCYIYYAAAKALLNMAGIENLDVVKSDTSRSAHFWLLVDLGDGWYHFDACPRKGLTPDRSFMLTDPEMDQYSREHDGSNIYDPSAYPERATQSVQYMVDYDAGVILEGSAPPV